MFSMIKNIFINLNVFNLFKKPWAESIAEPGHGLQIEDTRLIASLYAYDDDNDCWHALVESLQKQVQSRRSEKCVFLSRSKLNWK